MSLRQTAVAVVRRLQAAGFPAYWVGGCVRDQLLGQEPQDYDVATGARPEQIEALFAHTVPVGRQFGVIVVLEGSHSFQVATFRSEGDYPDGRHPGEVRFSDAAADARRRDFTVNGLFFDPVRGEIFDWVGGRADLEARWIRTIGAPEARFSEDHLRLLRAARFAAQLGFTIEPQTVAAARSLAPLIRTVSAERIRDELLKVFRPPHAARGLDLLQESGLLKEVLPWLEAARDCEQSPEFHPEGDLYEHIRRMLDRLPPGGAPVPLIWSVLLHDVGKIRTASHDPVSGAIHFYGHEKVGAAWAEEILEQLRFPRRQIDEITACVRNHMQFKDVRQMRTATLRRVLLRPTFPLELELHRLDCLGSHGRLDHFEFLQQQAAELSRQPALRPPLLTGHDLLALGMKPGPALGALLDQIRDKQLQEELTTPEEARRWAAERIQTAAGGKKDGQTGA